MEAKLFRGGHESRPVASFARPLAGPLLWREQCSARQGPSSPVCSLLSFSPLFLVFCCVPEPNPEYHNVNQQPENAAIYYVIWKYEIWSGPHGPPPSYGLNHCEVRSLPFSGSYNVSNMTSAYWPSSTLKTRIKSNLFSTYSTDSLT